MEEIFITEEELEYLTYVPTMVCEEAFPLKRKKSFEEESKGCITLEEFCKMWKDSIDNDPRFT